MDLSTPQSDVFRRWYALVAVGFVSITLCGCAISRTQVGYRWIINQNESGLLLVHGLPESDDIDLTFLCEGDRLHLWYSHSAKDEPYGTVHDTVVEITTGITKRTAFAKAEFRDGGSPNVDVIIADPASMLHDMVRGGKIDTKDRWGEYSAPTPPPDILRRFAKRCAIPMK
jgi:hypothetical protein